MSAWTINAALALPFVLGATSFDFVIDGMTFTATVAAGTYRVALAPSASDILRVLEAAMNAAGIPGDVAIAVSISAETGLVSITSSVSIALTDLHSTLLGRVLGYDSAEPSSLVQTAQRQPWFLALFCGLHGGVWTPRRSGASERTAKGVTYSFAGTKTSYDRELSAELIPWGPVEAAEADCPSTPMYPLPEHRENLGRTSTARVWSLLDVWTAGQNAGASIGCAMTLTWSTAITSTTERYDVGSLDANLLEPTRADERWNRYVSAKFTFVLPTVSQTGTRA